MHIWALPCTQGTYAPRHCRGCWPSGAVHVIVIAAAAFPVTVVIVAVLVFQDRVILCKPSCPGTHFLDQAILELRDLFG